jgi:hypothetical protein
VVIVEHEDERLANSRNFVNLRREQEFVWRRLWRLEHCNRGLSYALTDLSHRRDQIGNETPGIVVCFIEREPGNPHLIPYALGRGPRGEGAEPFDCKCRFT